MNFALPPEARDWGRRVRAFVDEELIPWEVEAELNGGAIPAEARARGFAPDPRARALQARPAGRGTRANRTAVPGLGA